MTESGSRIVSNINRIGTESSTFPTVCENCLGDDQFVRMTKANNGAACKICERAFTCFRWKAGNRGRFKSTIVCQLCARMKNVCQCCLLDLEFGLPVQVRDKYLAENEGASIPTSRAGIAYQVQVHARALESSTSSSGALAIEAGYAKLADNPHLQRIARTAPYYERNQAKICSFFVKGDCNRGESCPFRHEKPKDASLRNQNIEDRYHGINDPVAVKIQSRVDANLSKIPAPPNDVTISTLFLTGVPVTVDQSVIERWLKDQFMLFGEILNVKIIPTSGCAFVEFAKRSSAETAIVAKFNNAELTFEENRLKVHWARPKIGSSKVEKLNVPYPSMDPSNMGNSRLDSEKQAPL